MSAGRWALTLAGALLLALFAGCGPREDSDLEPLDLGGDFTLTGTDGRPFALSSLRGRTVLLFFGYTACPDVCPTTLARLTRSYEMLREEGLASRVTAVFISVDSERDTPQRLHDYLGYFALPVHGATGSAEQVARVVKAYGASFEKVPTRSAAGYRIDHSTYVYLVDPQGRVRHLFGHADSSERIAALTAKIAAADCCGIPTRPRRSAATVPPSSNHPGQPVVFTKPTVIGLHPPLETSRCAASVPCS